MLRLRETALQPGANDQSAQEASLRSLRLDGPGAALDWWDADPEVGVESVWCKPRPRGEGTCNIWPLPYMPRGGWWEPSSFLLHWPSSCHAHLLPPWSRRTDSHASQEPSRMQPGAHETVQRPGDWCPSSPGASWQLREIAVQPWEGTATHPVFSPADSHTTALNAAPPRWQAFYPNRETHERL